MDIRYSCNQKDFKRYTTEEMRDEMLITGLYKAYTATTSSALYRPVMSISSRISSVV